VETYPSTEYDIGGRSASGASPATDPTIAQYSGGSITSSFSEDYPSAGGWDAAYDLWTDDWKNETMIWNQWAGSSDYWPEKATIAVTLGGVGYTFYPNCSGPADAANEAHCEYMFFRDTQVTSGSVNILAAWLWEVANGYASASDVPTQLEYGVEVSYTSGTETFPMTGLTFNVTAADGVGFSSAAQPATSTPEAPSMVLLPLAALGVFGGAYGYRRRASKRRATDQGDPSQA
jgi:hypothetical protein